MVEYEKFSRVWCYLNPRLAADEIERLRAALKPIVEADWYTDGHGNYEGLLPGADLDRAKAVMRAKTEKR